MNRATGEPLAHLQPTDPNELPHIFGKVREAQSRWALLTPKKRAAILLQAREVLIRRADEIAELITKENGKPKVESLINDVVPCVDTLTYFSNRVTKLLKDKTIPLAVLKYRKSVVNYWPLGVVAVISPWNFPFLIPFCDIVLALLAGNGVIFKPSEVTPLVGLKIQEIFEEGGLPPGLLQTVIGDGQLGVALIKNKPNKIFFTGSVSTGKKVMAQAANDLIPVNLELGGKNPVIVLRDADLDFATSAALWGGYCNSGQVCAGTERILVHEAIKEPFINLLKEKLQKLRQGPSVEFENDLGPYTYDKQKETYLAHLADAKERSVEFVMGGEFSADEKYVKPTLITGSPEALENSRVYKEETFGPITTVTTFRSTAEAIQKANQTPYGLVAAILTQNHALAQEMARQLEVGTVTINEITYTAGLGETPWGGVKESGFGRTHSDIGFYEFCNVRHIHYPKSRLFVFKSFWWFPYTPQQYALFLSMIELYRKHLSDRLKAIPTFLWNLVHLIKTDKRL